MRGWLLIRRTGGSAAPAGDACSGGHSAAHGWAVSVGWTTRESLWLSGSGLESNTSADSKFPVGVITTDRTIVINLSVS